MLLWDIEPVNKGEREQGEGRISQIQGGNV